MKAAAKSNDNAKAYSIEVSINEANRVATRLSHCMSKEATRDYLQGICLQYDEKDGLLAVATDGYRLGRCKVRFTNSEQERSFKGMNCILPSEAVDYLQKLKGMLGTVTLQISEGKARIEYGPNVQVFNLVDGNYPDWKRLWDKACTEGNKEPAAFFNAAYLADIAKAFKGNKRSRLGLVFHSKDPKTEAVIIETPDTDVYYLLMPMR